jgi:hypothetical protein
MERNRNFNTTVFTTTHFTLTTIFHNIMMHIITSIPFQYFSLDFPLEGQHGLMHFEPLFRINNHIYGLFGTVREFSVADKQESMFLLLEFIF